MSAVIMGAHGLGGDEEVLHAQLDVFRSRTMQQQQESEFGRIAIELLDDIAGAARAARAYLSSTPEVAPSCFCCFGISKKGGTKTNLNKMAWFVPSTFRLLEVLSRIPVDS